MPNPNPPPNPEDKRQAAREVIDILHEISTLLVRDPTPRQNARDKAYAWL